MSYIEKKLYASQILMFYFMRFYFLGENSHVICMFWYKI